jgi:hypothetical protein
MHEPIAFSLTLQSRSTEQQQQKYQDMPIIKERGYVLFGKEEKRHTAIKTHRLFMVNNQASSSFIN